MGNKWQITLDVDEDEKDLLVAILEFAPGWPFAPVEEIEALTAKVKLAWIEREIEIVPPPSQWSAHSPVAVHRYVLRRDAPYPTREMVRRWTGPPKG